METIRHQNISLLYIWDMFIDSRNVAYRQERLKFLFFLFQSERDSKASRPPCHLITLIFVRGVLESRVVRKSHMKEPFDQTAVLIPTTKACKNFDQRSKESANSSQNRRDRDSQNMQHVMVFESADNDS